MKTEEEVKLMIARIEGRIEGMDEGDPYPEQIKLEALKWIMGEVEKI